MESMENSCIRVIFLNYIRHSFKLYLFIPFILRAGHIAILQENAIEIYKDFELMCRIEISPQLVKICNIFFDNRTGMLVYSDEYGNINFFDIQEGKEVFRYIEVIYIFI